MIRTTTFIILIMLIGCSVKENEAESTLKSFKVECIRAPYDLYFNFPKSFVSIRDLDEKRQMDTTDTELNGLLDMQFENPDVYVFFDSLDRRTNMLIKAGPRVDISEKERNITYFTVPTIRLSEVFLDEGDNRKIIFDSGKMRYSEKTYFKRKYRIDTDTTHFQDIYYITTNWQSVLVVVHSLHEIDVDRYVLDYDVKKSQSD